MKTIAVQFLSTAALFALVALVMAPASVGAQEQLTPEQFRANQEKLKAAITAMEKEEERQKSGATALDVKRETAAAKEAGRTTILENSSTLAAEDPAIARSKANIAARNARIRKNASPEMLVMLDPAKGKDPTPGAKPAPVSPKKAKKKKEIEIYADGGSTFNSEANLIVFEENVMVSHPGFELFCDKLIVFMKPGGETGEDGELPIDKAIAVGKVVEVRKMSDKGELRVGRSKKATFYGDTQDIVLQDTPSVQTGTILIEGRDPGTIMTLNENGKMDVDGRVYTLIVPEENSTNKALEKKDNP